MHHEKSLWSELLFSHAIVCPPYFFQLLFASWVLQLFMVLALLLLLMESGEERERGEERGGGRGERREERERGGERRRRKKEGKGGNNSVESNEASTTIQPTNVHIVFVWPFWETEPPHRLTVHHLRLIHCHLCLLLQSRKVGVIWTKQHQPYIDGSNKRKGRRGRGGGGNSRGSVSTGFQLGEKFFKQLRQLLHRALEGQCRPLRIDKEGTEQNSNTKRN